MELGEEPAFRSLADNLTWFRMIRGLSIDGDVTHSVDVRGQGRGLAPWRRVVHSSVDSECKVQSCHARLTSPEHGEVTLLEHNPQSSAS